MTQSFMGEMVGDDLPTAHQLNTLVQVNKPKYSVQQSQAIIYDFLLEIVKHWHPSEVLQEFQNLFIDQVGSSAENVLQSLYGIVFENDEVEFRNTLKRCCYILINNWYATRQYKAIQELIKIFENPKLTKKSLSPNLERLKAWLINFVMSKDYQELKLFAARYDGQEHWTNRFTSFLLVPQYIDVSNPIEQREAARAVSQRLKDQFKFDLAMYTARSQSAIRPDSKPKNPTGLGDEVLRLIKALVLRRGPFNYSNLAHIFIQQTENLTYKDFKANLIKYLTFYLGNKEFTKLLNKHLVEKLDFLYKDYHEEVVNDSLLFRTCNRIIEYLITENKKDPSALFILFLTQGNSLNLVVVLVKIVLICKTVRPHLDACMAAVIQYYEKYPEEECKWVINFLELFNITFAIYAEDVEYNLVQMKGAESSGNGKKSRLNLDAYRIFSQLKDHHKLDDDT